MPTPAEPRAPATSAKENDGQVRATTAPIPDEAGIDNQHRSIQLHQPLLHFPLRPLTHWFADTTNSITDFFAKRVQTKELCVDDVCVTRDQLAAILAGTGAGAPASGNGGRGAPASSSAEGGEADDNPATTTDAVDAVPSGTPDEPAADAPGEVSGTETPDGSSAQEEDVGDAEGAEVTTDTSGPAEPSPPAEAVSPPSTEEPANDIDPADPLPATGTE
jgi:hypothetical protein